MSKCWIYLALVVFGSVAASAAEVPAHSPQCVIHAAHIRGGLRLEGVVRGTPGASGSYRFVLDEVGSDGNSKVGQGGNFVVAPFGESVVAESELSFGRGTSYRANMVVTSALGEATCSAMHAHRAGGDDRSAVVSAVRNRTG